MSRGSQLGWLAAIGAVAMAIASWAWPDAPRAPDAAPGGAEVGTARSVPAASPVESAEPPAGGATDLVRTAAANEQRAPSPAASWAQGLRGVVLDQEGRALPGLPVYLVDSASNDPMAMPLLRQQPDAFGPMASCTTEANGAFAVGVPVAQDRLYELYVVSKQHATARLGGLRVLPNQWHELEPIRMTAGASLRGRVTVHGRGDIPVPMATVTVEVGAAFADAALRALPEAGHGLCATADNNGEYLLEHVPSRGAVQVAAVARGFARTVKPNIELSLEHPVELNFALTPGTSLRGEVVTATNQPIAGARTEAWPRAAAGGPFLGQSDERGHFEVLGLAAGSYRLRITAKGYDRHEEEEVATDGVEPRIVLYEQSRVRVRVVTPDGQVVHNYQLGLRRVFPEQNHQIAAVTDVPEQRVRLDGLTDSFVLTGIPVGLFACQVEAEGFAKTLSETFDNRREPNAPKGPRQFDLVVTMRTGASVRGRVLTEGGEPLVGAVVTTQPNGTLPESPLMRILAASVPYAITAARATTDGDGSFLLTRLALADYQLQVDHADACRQLVPNILLTRDGEHELPPIRLRGGAIVAGRATVAGRAAGQLKVVLTTPTTVATAAEALRLETVTDPEGRFRFARRVPPGAYELRAATVGTSEPEAQIFLQLLQLQRSCTTLSVAPGQRQIECSIDLPSDH